VPPPPPCWRLITTCVDNQAWTGMRLNTPPYFYPLVGYRTYSHGTTYQRQMGRRERGWCGTRPFAFWWFRQRSAPTLDIHHPSSPGRQLPHLLCQRLPSPPHACPLLASLPPLTRYYPYCSTAPLHFASLLTPPLLTLPPYLPVLRGRWAWRTHHFTSHMT